MKKIISILCAAVLVLSLLLYSNSEQNSDYTYNDYPDSQYLENVSEQTQKADDTETKRVGVAMPTSSSERWINDGINMKAKLEALGYEVDLQNADDDIELQISQIKNMIKNGADCLVIASIDSVRLTGVLNQAKLNGIPVIAYDRLLMDTDAVSYYASFDNKAVGTLIGKYIEEKKALKTAASEGRSYTIEFFMGSPDDNNALFLYNGLMEVLKPYLENGVLICRSGKTSFEDTCILRWSESAAEEMCDKYITEYYKDEPLDIACSAFDGFAYGIKDACIINGYTHTDWPLITGQDAEIAAVKGIAEGYQEMTIYKDSRVLSSKCVKMVEAVLDDSEPELNDITTYNNNVMTVPSYLCVPVAIDSKNYEEILINGGYYTKEQLFK